MFQTFHSKIIINKFKILFFFVPLFSPQSILAADPEPIRIGGLVVLTGQYAMQGQAFREGLELAAADLKLKNLEVELYIEDTANLPVQALTGVAIEELGKRYEQKFHKPMTLSWFVTTAYDAVHLIVQCAKRNPQDSIAIKNCLATTKDFQGVNQIYTFNPGGSSRQFEGIFQIRGGKFQLSTKE
jgi:ABC-type branched-subunit amino acid transport system substrate-binding protein